MEKICKCGDPVTKVDEARLKSLRVTELNVPDYPRCSGCLRILTSSIVRLRNKGSKFSYTGKR